MTAAVTVAVLACLGACAGRDPSIVLGAGEGEGEGEGEGDWPPCDVEEDCASLGPGHMCMNGGCMLMEVDAPAVVVPAPSEQDLALPLLVDVDPDPAVFEGTLVAAEREVSLVPGAAPTTMWVYLDGNVDGGDGPARVPGPRVDVVSGTRVKIHLQNDLLEATTIHWHGLVLPADMDGSGMPGTEVEPGASFDFDFVAGDASLFWFHPHLRGDVQIERGLYAPFVVRPAVESEEPRVGVEVDVERIFVLDDVLLGDDDQVAPRHEGSVMLDDGRMSFEGMMGRQGNRLLVNGRANPILDVVPGTVERWRIVDVANSRFFRLALAGHAFVQIGTDVGLVPEPRTLDDVLIAPGERIDLLVAIGTPPDGVAQLPLVTKHHDRGHDMADPGDLTLATLRFSSTPKVPATAVPAVSRALEALVADAGDAVQRVVMEEQVLRGGKVGFSLNGELFPDVTPLGARRGATEAWEIVNQTHMDHPFHLHGAPFQVQSTTALDDAAAAPAPETFFANKDVVIVPPRTTLRFVVRYPNAGTWMFHCHILEHAENGMMSMIDVAP